MFPRIYNSVKNYLSSENRRKKTRLESGMFAIKCSIAAILIYSVSMSAINRIQKKAEMQTLSVEYSVLLPKLQERVEYATRMFAVSYFGGLVDLKDEKVIHSILKTPTERFYEEVKERKTIDEITRDNATGFVPRGIVTPYVSGAETYHKSVAETERINLASIIIQD